MSSGPAPLRILIVSVSSGPASLTAPIDIEHRQGGGGGKKRGEGRELRSVVCASAYVHKERKGQNIRREEG